MAAVPACSLCGSGACARANVDLCRTLNRFRSPGRDDSGRSASGQASTPITRAATPPKGRARR